MEEVTFAWALNKIYRSEACIGRPRWAGQDRCLGMESRKVWVREHGSLE